VTHFKRKDGKMKINGKQRRKEMVVACSKVVFLKSFGETKNDDLKVLLRVNV
jgi:hypothetical protein